MPDTVYTIGHSNHTIERLVALLRQHGITAVCDVRSAPYSRYNPHFDREALKASLEAAGMAYVFLGKELGARSEDPTCYLHGKIQYGKLAETSLFQQGLQRVQEGMKRFSVALLCAEKDPLECHRTILVSRCLDALGVPIEHILAGGQLESHAHALTRLAQSLGLRAEEQHLFRSHDDLIADAYLMQEERIGYVTIAEAAAS